MNSSRRPAAWQLPPGVTPELWEDLYSAEMAAQYEAGLVSSSVVAAETAFLARHLPARGLVIDLGCGTGRHVRTLQNTQRDVVGVDLSPAMLAEAARLGAGPLVRENLVGLQALRSGCADAALCLYSTLGLIHPAAARRRVVAAARRVLRPGGVWIVHVHNRYAALGRPGQRWWWLRDFLQSWWTGGEAGNWPMPPHQGVARLTMHLFTHGEIVRLLGDEGFEIIEVMPLGLSAHGGLRWPGWLPSWRAQGFLVAARVAGSDSGIG
jgi:SAM-dependent methyltransferase